MFNLETFFEVVRSDPFGGSLIQDQVDGMNYILDTWEDAPPSDDLRWLAYALATTYHETAATMLPIAEYGYGGLERSSRGPSRSVTALRTAGAPVLTPHVATCTPLVTPLHAGGLGLSL